jgi:fructose-1,6-bisphosphatase/inositol monophosphatase family enzyme
MGKERWILAEERKVRPLDYRRFRFRLYGCAIIRIAGLAESSLDKVLRRSVDDNAWDEESDEVWRGMDRSSRYGRARGP